jgi:Protein of unknown function (DUF3486)
MPQKSAAKKLPQSIRTELDRQLQKNNFSNYTSLSQWLGEQGYRISRSGVHRYSQELKGKLDRAEDSAIRARAIAEQFPDGDPVMSRALSGIVQQELLDHLIADGFSAEGLTSMEIIRAIKDICSSDLAQQKWQVELQRQIDAKLAEMSAAAPERGLGERTIKRIREEIYGIVL